MIDNDFFRTDLAVEEKERVKDSIPGIEIHENIDKFSKINISTVLVKTSEAGVKLNKPVGTYITLSGGCLDGHTDEDVQKSAAVLGKVLKSLLPNGFKSVFVLGLGNADMTADALGPETIKKLLVNRGMTKAKHELSALTPGVMGQTGLEAGEIVSGIIEKTRPDVMITVDALCAMSEKRLLSTVQLCDSGIIPGSGVGNHRSELSNNTLSIPVISIGIPTVIGAYSLINSALADIENKPDESLLKPLYSMFVTSKDIDLYIKEKSVLLAEAIHHIIYPD